MPCRGLSGPTLTLWPSSGTRPLLMVRGISHDLMDQFSGPTGYNTHSHRIGQLAGAFSGEDKFVHKKPLDYAFEYRHWRDLLLEEQCVDEDENEAHIFDLDPRILGLLIQTYHELTSNIHDGRVFTAVFHPHRKPGKDPLVRLMDRWPNKTRKGVPTADIFDDTFGWFVRTERKCINSSRPVTSFRELVEVIVNDRRAVGDLHRICNPGLSVHSDDASLAEFWKPKTMSVYLSPWKPTLSHNPKLGSPNGMWRVFVPPPGHGIVPKPFRISAISQLHCDYAYMSGAHIAKGDQKIRLVAEEIFSVCLPKIESILNDSWDMDGVKRQFRDLGFVFDVFESDGGFRSHARILDIKPFGALSNTRSCAFSWVQNAQILYGLGLEKNGAVRIAYLS